MTCRALRPRGRPTPLPNTRCRMVSSGQIKPSTIPQCTLTGLYHFSPKAYGLSPLCLRLTSRVTHTGSRLDTKRGGSPLLGRHFQPLVNTAPRGAQLVNTILWLGWFGFNGGSELKVSDVGEANAVALVFVNTNMAAAGGLVFALILAGSGSAKGT